MQNNIIKKEKYIIYSPYQMAVSELLNPKLEVQIETRKNGEKVVLVDFKEEQNNDTD